LKGFTENIVIIFLYLAGAVIIAHSVIPHDHHPDVSVYENDFSCKGSSEHSHHHFPFHCHALNDLVCEKFTFPPVFIPDSFSLLGISPVSELADYTNLLTSCQLKFLEIGVPVPVIYNPGNGLFRAPPSII
jgi:hypothetical protein